MKNLKLKNQIPVENSLLKIENSSSIKVNARLRAFTLIELITVMSILAFLIATAVGAYFAWNQTSALRGATDLTLSGLHRARQFAITQRVDTYVYFESFPFGQTGPRDGNAFFTLRTNAADNLPLEPCLMRQDFPRNILFSFNGEQELDFVFYFKPNGRPYYGDDTRFEEDQNAIHLHLLRGGTNTVTQTILIDPLTGVARPIPR